MPMSGRRHAKLHLINGMQPLNAAMLKVDTDERVRAQAVSVICTCCCSQPNLLFHIDLETSVSRLRDSKIIVRKEAITSLALLFSASFPGLTEGCLSAKSAATGTFSANVSEQLYRVPEGIILSTAFDPDSSLRALSEKTLQENLIPNSITPDEAALLW
eukprot:scaffold307101_cov49-Prasinocladus_malaysianus.AAC.1